MEISCTLELFLFIFLSRRKHCLSVVFCLYIATFLPSAVLGDRTAFVDLQKVYKNGHKIKLSNDVLVQTKGSFADVGAVKRAEGIVHQLPEECGENDEEWFSRIRPKDWVALINYPYRDHSNQTYGANGTNCLTVLDRVKKAMMFGASAIIILALNPKIVKELEMAQIFSNPIVMIQTAENVSAVLQALLYTIRVKITYNASFYDLQKASTFTLWATCGVTSGVESSYGFWEGVVCLGGKEESSKKVSMWSSCGRASPGSGVVCTKDDYDEEKADPSHFWNYFFCMLAMIMLLLVIKTRSRPNLPDDLEQLEQSLRRKALQALSGMKTKRYKKLESSINSNDSERDTCAVCLEEFQQKQRLRVLPCRHEFHKNCVDPWLVKQRTCPLCKLNIIEGQTLPART